MISGTPQWRPCCTQTGLLCSILTQAAMFSIHTKQAGRGFGKGQRGFDLFSLNDCKL